MFKLINKKNNRERNGGFTLIEMMVSVSIFVIVAFIVVSTLLTMSYAYKKAQKMRLLMDNFNFALQSMSLNIREGIDYEACDDGSCIDFRPINSWIQAGNTDRVCYYLQTIASGNKVVKKCNNACSFCGVNDSNLTSPDIDIDNLKFILTDSLSGKKSVKILIGGTAGTVPKEKTTFFIQNTVTQRNPD